MLKFRLVAFYDTQDERHHYSDPVKHGKSNETYVWIVFEFPLLAIFIVDLLNERRVSPNVEGHQCKDILVKDY